MTIDHIALYTNDLEKMRSFYETYFGAVSNKMYQNKSGLKTYFLSFQDKTRLEIMTRPDLISGEKSLAHTGYIHFAIGTGSKEMVDSLTNRLRQDGFEVVSGPRTTGDGYYESCVLDPDGNQIEITI